MKNLFFNVTLPVWAVFFLTLNVATFKPWAWAVWGPGLLFVTLVPFIFGRKKK